MTASSPLAASAIGEQLVTAIAAAAANSESAEFYEELRDGFAKEMVEQYATGTLVLVKPAPVEEGGDPLNPFGGASPRRTTRSAIVTGFPSDKIDGKQILAGDRRVLIDAADFTAATEPAGDDQLEIDGKTHMMVSLQAIPAAGVAVVYIMQARTGG
jgi:hypothetical protein